MIYVVSFAMICVLVGGLLCVLLAAEMAFPREPLMDRRQRARVLLFWAIGLPTGALCGRIMANFTQGIPPLVGPPPIAEAVVAVLLADFLYYWYHRAQHSIGWLWRIHSVHHSAEKMGAGAGFHHLLEIPLKAVLVNAPGFLLIGADAGFVGFIFVLIHGFYLHSTTRLNFGPLAWILCDNRVHRIHHSLEPAHFDRNFGVVTLLWDRLFGTAYFPRADEWPETGLSDQREPRTFVEWLKLPGRRLVESPPALVGDRLQA